MSQDVVGSQICWCSLCWDACRLFDDKIVDVEKNKNSEIRRVFVRSVFKVKVEREGTAVLGASRRSLLLLL